MWRVKTLIMSGLPGSKHGLFQAHWVSKLLVKRLLMTAINSWSKQISIKTYSPKHYHATRCLHKHSTSTVVCYLFDEISVRQYSNADFSRRLVQLFKQRNYDNSDKPQLLAKVNRSYTYIYFYQPLHSFSSQYKDLFRSKSANWYIYCCKTMERMLAYHIM